MGRHNSRGYLWVHMILCDFAEMREFAVILRECGIPANKITKNFTGRKILAKNHLLKPMICGNAGIPAGKITKKFTGRKNNSQKSSTSTSDFAGMRDFPPIKLRKNLPAEKLLAKNHLLQQLILRECRICRQ